MNRTKPMRVFLSFAHEDRKSAQPFQQELEDAGLEVWSAESRLFPGDNWGAEVSKALDSSDAMVALISPQAAKSPFIKREWEYAITQPRFRDRLFPVMLRKTRDFPWILNNLSLVDATKHAKDAPRQLAEAVRSRM